MRTRAIGFVAVERFIAVERYYQSHQPPSAHPLPGSGLDRAGGHAGKQDSGTGAQASARPRQG
jgi:hypothetical protein